MNYRPRMVEHSLKIVEDSHQMVVYGSKYLVKHRPRDGVVKTHIS